MPRKFSLTEPLSGCGSLSHRRRPFTNPYGGTKPLLVSTTTAIDGRVVQDYLGMAHGIAICRRRLDLKFNPGDLLAPEQWRKVAEQWKTAVLPEPGEEEARYDASRIDAYESMVREAEQLGADAVIGVRYEITPLREGSLHILAYGTAVRLRRPGLGDESGSGGIRV